MARTWTQQQIWQQLNPYQRAAAMAIMEADGRNPTDARNVLGAIINRSEKTGEPLGEHVSKPIYQPTIEMSQFARLPSILKSQQFQEMTALAERRAKGQEGDWVQGATHFLAPEKTMLDLHRKNPDKYHNWGPLPNSRGVPGKNWTGYDPQSGEYRGVIMRDGSHAFLAPEGRHDAAPARPADPFDGKPTAIATAENALPKPAETPHDMLAGLTPSLDAPGAPSGTMMASAAPVHGSTRPGVGSDAALLYASSFFDQQGKDQEESQSKLEKLGRQAAAAIPTSKANASMIQGPRTPRIDMRSLLSVLQQRGVDLTGGGGLGTGGGALGTRRA